MQENESIAVALQDLIDAKEVSQAQAAREIGISASALSGFLKGSYAGDADAIGKRLSQWLSDREKRSLTAVKTAWAEWAETRTAERISTAIGHAHLNGAIALVYGGAGVGKTAAVKRYADAHPNVWVSTMTPAHSGVFSTLKEIAFSLRLDSKDPIGMPALLLREIVQRVEGTRGLLVVDEAQHLCLPAIEAVRAIHDAAGIGLVLCGNHSVYSRISGGKRAAEFAQLFSRIGFRLRVDRLLRSDLDEFAEANGLTGKQEKQAVWEIGKKPGGLRSVVNVLMVASVVAMGADKAVDAAMIRAAWVHMTGESVEQA